ncbi:MAG: hypothetical protein AB1505_23265 [Candidatus Latescibacterota bacterium]
MPHLVLAGDEEGTVDFGILDLGEIGEQELVVGNTGTGALRVDQIRATESQVAAEPESLIVAAGASRRVRLRLQADARQGTQGILRLASNDPEQPVVRLRYQYTLSVPEFAVLTEPLVFGRGQGGQRRAPLVVLNQGNARGIVELVDASAELSFDQERLVIQAGQVGRAQARYAGSGGGGQLVLVTNSPAQRQLTVAWRAQAVLEVTASVPAAGETGVALETVLGLVFSRPLRRAGSGLAGDGGPGIASLSLRIVPEPLNAWQPGMRAQGREVRIPLRLGPEQSYRVLVLQAEGQEGGGQSLARQHGCGARGLWALVRYDAERQRCLRADAEEGPALLTQRRACPAGSAARPGVARLAADAGVCYHHVETDYTEDTVVRTQIQLTEEQARLAKRLAAEHHVSMAEIIRQALDRALRSWAEAPSEEERIRRAIDAAGRFRSGSADGSTRHDQHLAEAYQA